MLERVVITLLIAATVGAMLHLLSRWQKSRANISVKGLALNRGTPALVYFFSPGCSACRTSQKPILERLRSNIGDARIQWVSVDASAQLETARQWGITTLPTTCVIDATGQVTNVNNGLATERELRRQLLNDTEIGCVG